MRRKRFILGLISLFFVSFTAGCLPTQTIIVRFEDLKSDMFALEAALRNGEWAKFDWDTMTITISAAPGETATSQTPASRG